MDIYQEFLSQKAIPGVELILEAVERAVVTGETVRHDGAAHVEILTGLEAGDTVIVP